MIMLLTTRNNHSFSLITGILSHFITLCILKQQMPFLFSKVGQKRWKVETFSRLDSVLLLSSVNLPGGELVRKTLNISPVQRLLFFSFQVRNYGILESLGAYRLHKPSGWKLNLIGRRMCHKVYPDQLKRPIKCITWNTDPYFPQLSGVEYNGMVQSILCCNWIFWLESTPCHPWLSGVHFSTVSYRGSIY